MSRILKRGHIAAVGAGAASIAMIQANMDNAVINVSRLTVINVGEVNILRPNGKVSKFVSRDAVTKTLVTVEDGTQFVVGDYLIARELSKDSEFQGGEFKLFQVDAVNANVLTLDVDFPDFVKTSLINYGKETDSAVETYTSIVTKTEIISQGEVGYYISDTNMPMLMFKDSAVAVLGGTYYVTQD